MKNINLEQAYQQGIISFEQALKLAAMGEEVSMETAAKAPKSAPKKSAPKRRKSKKAPQPEVKKSETGKVYYTPKKHELTAAQVKRLDNAVLKLWEAGFDKAEWRVEGKWAWIYTFSGEKGTGYSPAFKQAVAKAFKGSKWAYSASRGAVVYKDFLK